MISRALLFPRSNYLANQWWHRLATVIFWIWLVAIVVYLYNNLIYDPFASCIQVKIALSGEPSGLNCGSNPFDYAWINISAESLPSSLLSGGILAIAIYVATILPSLAYRILLYIAKGNSWRDSDSASAA